MSLWSMLSSIVLISMSFLVRYMRPFCVASGPLLSGLESEGADNVAATRAAIAVLSSGDLLPES